MGAPAASLAAGAAVRHRGLLGPLVLAALLLVALLFLIPVVAVVALSAGGGAFAPSPVALADIPADYLAHYQRAAAVERLDWAVLAAVGKVECDHGRNRDDGCRAFTRNGAGAVGPMQFLPSTFAAGHRIGEVRVVVTPRPGRGYATDGDGDRLADIWNPADAIASAARMLAANGAPGDYRRALFAYNHADWYVDRVLAQAAEYRSAAASGGSGAVIGWAERFLGTPYVWGGNHGRTLAEMRGSMPRLAPGRDGRIGFFDCSSLTAWSFANGAGIWIGETASDQWQRAPLRGVPLPPGGLQPGDLVFFHDVDHVGIYLGGDRFVHAPHTGANVMISRLSTYSGFVGWARWPIGGAA